VEAGDVTRGASPGPGITWVRLRDAYDREIDMTIIGLTSYRVVPFGERFCVEHRPNTNGTPWREIKKAPGPKQRYGAVRLWASRDAAKRAVEGAA
jgi:hypothetical protein